MVVKVTNKLIIIWNTILKSFFYTHCEDSYTLCLFGNSTSEKKEILLSWLSYSKYFGDLQLNFEDHQSFLKECLQWLVLKPNYFKKQCSSSSFLLTWSRYTGPKWLWSLSRPVQCLKWLELECQVLLGHFGPVYLLQVNKNDDEEHCF
jgi:hypothetical protein